MSLDKEQNTTQPDSGKPDQPQRSIPQIDGDDGGDVIRVIMDGDDPMINARDRLTRHMGMTIGATMVSTGIYTAYTWGSGWLWYFLTIIWGAALLHSLLYWFRRLKAGSPGPAYQISMESGGEASDAPDTPLDAAEPEESGLVEPEPSSPAGRIIEPPRHKITIIQPREDDG